MKRLRKIAPWTLALVALLVAIRAALPIAVQRYVNRTLDRIPEYDGRIGDVDLHLWRGAYEIEDVSLVKTTGQVPVPLFASPKVDLSVEWGQLWKGRFVGEVALDRPEINFAAAPTPDGQQGAVDSSWIDRVTELFPLKLDKVRVHGGRIRYHDFYSDPKVHLELADVEAVATNLTNRPTPDLALPAGVEATGRLEGGGVLKLQANLAPLADEPTFTLDSSFEGVPLPALNDLLKAYANVDAEKGTFSAYIEVAARDGAFEGYVKPLLKDVEFAKWRENESLGRRLWENIVQLAAKVLENPEAERVATRIPLRGRFDKPQPDLWATVGGLLRNAFIEALRPGIEGSIGPLPKKGKG
jgi:hypothetical protein